MTTQEADAQQDEVDRAERCDRCYFWLIGDNQEEKDPDDKIGPCRRHAPRPTMGDIEQFDKWASTAYETCLWPSTWGSSWCGDFRPKLGATLGPNQP